MTKTSRQREAHFTELRPRTTQVFHQSILDAGLLRESGVRGVYHRSFEFERIIEGISLSISRAGENRSHEQLFCSSVMSRRTLEKCGFLTSFPDLVGSIESFTGNDDDLATLKKRVGGGKDWSDLLTTTSLVMCSAACQNIYPLLTDVPIPPAGLMYEVKAQCFRHEPSDDLARMLTFRQHEYVFIGTEHDVREHAVNMRENFCDVMDGLSIAYEVAVASDPFFGRMGRLLAESQHEKSLKYEFIVPLSSQDRRSIGSANFHEDHFGSSFGLTMTDGSVAHSSCVGFGLERVALALLFEHGVDSSAWPSAIRTQLGLDLVTP